MRWFRDHTAPEALARDHGISRATGYRYVDEVIAALADQAPDLREALAVNKLTKRLGDEPEDACGKMKAGQPEVGEH